MLQLQQPITNPHPYRWTWFDWFCLWYPPGWLILFNRHWQHYHPDPDGWNGLEYGLFLIPGGFYLALLLRWIRLGFRVPNSETEAFDPNYQQAFREEILSNIVQHYFQAELQQLENLPPQGPLMVAMNHAGMCFPWDFIVLGYLLGESRGWATHPLAGTSLFEHPMVRWWLPVGWSQVLGGIRAKWQDFQAAAAHQPVLLYAPEGLRGPGKGWFRRYQLETFHPSFIQLSDRFQLPILPVVCLGNEGLHPWAINLKPLANLLSMPFLPLSPLMPLFLLFPSMGVWVMRSRLQYFVQPLYHSPAPETPSPRENRHRFYTLAQQLQVKLQSQIQQRLSHNRKQVHFNKT